MLLSLPALSQARPNVLLIYVDDLGYGDLGSYGHPVLETPVIDRLASEGVRFTQFYAPSALCSPSRAGLLTGRMPYRTGVRDWIPDGSDTALGENETTLADLARAAGYRTAVIGKWHLNGDLGDSRVPQPRDFGFDYQYGLSAFVKNAAVEEQRQRPRRGHLYPDNFYRDNEAVGPTEKYSAELVSDEALRWLAEDEQPFFLLLTYSEPHTPVAAPQRWLEHYERYLTAEARENPLTYYFDWRNRPWRGPGEYYATVSFLDEQLGRVIDHLREAGTLDNTLVIFSSDNGPVTREALMPWELNMAGDTSGLRGKKRYLFEGGIRVPGIMRLPGRIEAGVELHEAVTALDIFPTLAEFLDVEVDAEVPLDGQSLWPLLDAVQEDVAWTRSRPLFWALGTPDGLEYALRDGDWKLLLDADGTPEYLFNLVDDRYEVYNRLDAEPVVLKRMREHFEAALEAVAEDPLLTGRRAAQSR